MMRYTVNGSGNFSFSDACTRAGRIFADTGYVVEVREMKPRDYVCPDGPSCPDPDCRREREARGFPLAPPVVNTRDCAHTAMVANDDPLFAWKCADCGRIYGEDVSR